MEVKGSRMYDGVYEQVDRDVASGTPREWLMHDNDVAFAYGAANTPYADLTQPRIYYNDKPGTFENRWAITGKDASLYAAQISLEDVGYCKTAKKVQGFRGI